MATTITIEGFADDEFRRLIAQPDQLRRTIQNITRPYAAMMAASAKTYSFEGLADAQFRRALENVPSVKAMQMATFKVPAGLEAASQRFAKACASHNEAPRARLAEALRTRDFAAGAAKQLSEIAGGSIVKTALANTQLLDVQSIIGKSMRDLAIGINAPVAETAARIAAQTRIPKIEFILPDTNKAFADLVAAMGVPTHLDDEALLQFLDQAGTLAIEQDVLDDLDVVFDEDPALRAAASTADAALARQNPKLSAAMRRRLIKAWMLFFLFGIVVTVYGTYPEETEFLVQAGGWAYFLTEVMDRCLPHQASPKHGTSDPESDSP